MNIAILIISTGNYNKFIEPLVNSINKYLNVNDHKDIFLFSDEHFDGVINKPASHNQWPFVTLKRFDTFRSIYKDLAAYDFVLYLDVDLEIVENIELPFKDIELLGVSHPSNLRMKNFWPVENNMLSSAYLSKTPGMYYQGCLWGASRDCFLAMNETLAKNIEFDLEKQIIAKWHDESHLNRYYDDHSKMVTTLTPSYAYPENWNLSVDKIIIHKDKNMQEYPRFEGVR